jgi:hypothetical protein
LVAHGEPVVEVGVVNDGPQRARSAGRQPAPHVPRVGCAKHHAWGRAHSGNIPGPFREHSGLIQGTFRTGLYMKARSVPEVQEGSRLHTSPALDVPNTMPGEGGRGEGGGTSWNFKLWHLVEFLPQVRETTLLRI